jgi:hypothetical protein
VRLIDVHTHAFPRAVAGAALRSLEEMAGVKPSFDGTEAGLLATLDEAGVERAAVQPVAVKADQVAAINDWVAGLDRGRIVPFGAMHPDLADAAAEVARIAEKGFVGFKLHPEFQRFSPDEPRMEPIYEAAAAHGLIIFFHAGRDIAVPTYRGRPACFARVHARHPELTLILAHLGGWGVWEEVREQLAGTGVYLDTAFTLGHLPATDFVDLVRRHGPERVVFGSDAPWADLGAEVEKVAAAGLDDDELAAVFAGTAAGLLGI